jgi:SAM-dependent methyltransferase
VKDARAKSSPELGPPPLGRGELFLTVFVTGAAALAIEILGTRIVGPSFGVSLFVWSALLAVTLGALATGYYVGGVVIDRVPTPRLLGLAVTASGVLLGLVRASSHLVLQSAERLGPRSGALISAAVLFAPSLVALGMTGPIAVRLATRDLRAAGRNVGSIYAVSTAGSLVATLVIGFWVVPAFETDQILTGTATVLILLGAGSLARRGRRSALALVFVPALASAIPKPSLPSGLDVLARSQSLLGLVEVIDDRNRGVRFLRADHSIIGAEFTRDHSPGFAFIHLLESVRFLRPRATNMLEVGLGIGSLPMVLGRRGIKADIVEIDPAVVRFAQQYFGFSTRGEIHVEDARTFLRLTDQRYDLIVHDTFTGGTTPDHLLSLEVLKRIHELLRPGGVLALNFVGYADGPQAEGTWAVARTVRAVFSKVRMFGDGPPQANPGEARNLVFFASDAAIEFNVPQNADFDGPACEQVLRAFQGWEMPNLEPDGPVITDAHNPLARLQLPIAEAHFAAMNKLLPVEVWAH